jgi:hypothetical protein
LIYAAYERDFIHSRPTFRGVEVHPKRHPEYQGRCGTFWHVTSQTINGSRVIRPNRCERIQWIRAMIEATSVEGRVCVYCVEHEGGELRWEIALPDFSYVVVLASRAEGSHLLLWTAFEQEQDHRRRKARKKYDAWIESQKKLKPPSL